MGIRGGQKPIIIMDILGKLAFKIEKQGSLSKIKRHICWTFLLNWTELFPWVQWKCFAPVVAVAVVVAVMAIAVVVVEPVVVVDVVVVFAVISVVAVDKSWAFSVRASSQGKKNYDLAGNFWFMTSVKYPLLTEFYNGCQVKNFWD